MTDDAKIFQALLRTDFKVFFEKVFSELHPGTDYLDNWHVDAIAWNLEQVRNGDLTRLIINVPPRYGKSLMVSVAFVAFLLGHDPSLKIIVVSYAESLVVTLKSSSSNAFMRSSLVGVAMEAERRMASV